MSGAEPTPPTIPSRADIFYQFARKATGKSHEALKNCWVILFAGGTFALIHSFDDFINCSFFSWSLPQGYATSHPFCSDIKPYNYYFFLSLLLFFVYGLTFYRFYVGNIRMFDIIYNEVFEFFDNLEKIKSVDRLKLLEYSGSLMKGESFFLILTAMIIVYLTVTPINPPKFLTTYLILLAADIAWMVWMKWSSSSKTTLEVRGSYFSDEFETTFERLRHTKFRKVFPSYAICIWNGNNIVFLVIIFIILATYRLLFNHVNEETELLVLWCGAGAALLNCVLDIGCAWDFYHPKFTDAYKIVADPNPPQRDKPPQGDIECWLCRLLFIITCRCAPSKATNSVSEPADKHVSNAPTADGGSA
jgi:hypothetical protein